MFKISVITICYNSEKTILNTINSVKNQNYKNIEYIIIDGGSTDNTISIINNSNSNHILISESDKGIYDAMNKGIKIASGDFITFLNSDDQYVDNNIINEVNKHLTCNIDITYGDVIFYKNNINNKIYRKYKSNIFKPQLIKFGIMPAHPGMFINKNLFRKHGLFNIEFKISGDFEFIARIFKTTNIIYIYIPKALVFMQSGGISNKNLFNKILLNIEIYKACKLNNYKTNYLFILLRYIIKIKEYIK